MTGEQFPLRFEFAVVGMTTMIDTLEIRICSESWSAQAFCFAAQQWAAEACLAIPSLRPKNPGPFTLPPEMIRAMAERLGQVFSW